MGDLNAHIGTLPDAAANSIVAWDMMRSKPAIYVALAQRKSPFLQCTSWGKSAAAACAHIDWTILT